MSERLKGHFMGCPYHDDDYEACIQYSGQAPCDPPDGWKLVPMETTEKMRQAFFRAEGIFHQGIGEQPGTHWRMMLEAAPSPGQEE